MTATSHSYYVVMIDYGRRGREAIVDPEMTRRDVVSRISSGEYPRDMISFIHHVTTSDRLQDVTAELLAEARFDDNVAAISAALDRRVA